MSIIDVVPVIRTSFACVYARAVHTDDAEPVHQRTVNFTVGAAPVFDQHRSADVGTLAASTGEPLGV